MYENALLPPRSKVDQLALIIFEIKITKLWQEKCGKQKSSTSLESFCCLASIRYDCQLSLLCTLFAKQILSAYVAHRFQTLKSRFQFSFAYHDPLPGMNCIQFGHKQGDLNGFQWRFKPSCLPRCLAEFVV